MFIQTCADGYASVNTCFQCGTFLIVVPGNQLEERELAVNLFGSDSPPLAA